MIAFLADENLNRSILTGVLLRDPDIDFVRAQDVGLAGANDDAILRRAAQHERILVTQDISTVTPRAWKRVARGHRMSGVILVKRKLPVSEVIEEILPIAARSEAGEWKGVVTYLPL